MVNDSRGHDARKVLAEELAARLATQDGARTARLLQAAGLLRPSAEPEPTPEEPADGRARPISIWTPRTEADGSRVFVRPPPHPFGDHHAETPTLHAAKPAGVRRVVLFGESAAAGYLYAPHLTPARVLAAQLEAARPGAYQVIDLARTNERLDTMTRTVGRARQLAPDLLVVFAGNNWTLLETPEHSAYAPSLGHRQAFALALRQGGLHAALRRAERALAERAERALERIAGEAAAAGAGVVLVVPEVNLADWPQRQPVHWLPGDGVGRWYRLLARATAALDAGRATDAVRHGRALLALDGGLCATGHRLLGTALDAAGERGAARDAWRRAVARDAYANLAFLGAPRATPAVQALLRAAARRHGFALVDLPAALAAAPASAIPGRDLFLDYCHLSAAGMARAGAHIAAAVLAADGRPVDAATLVAAAPRVDPAVHATAALGAAVHSAHRLAALGDPAPLLTHWCRAALDADAGVIEAMRDLAVARAAPLPAVLSAAQPRNAGSPYRLSLQHGWRWAHLDLDVVRAMRSAAAERGLDLDQERDLVAELLRDHRIGPEARELLRPPYPWSPLEQLFPDAMDDPRAPARAVLRAPWPTSRFAVIAAAGAAVRLRVTARLPAIPGGAPPAPAEAAVTVDGRRCGMLRLEAGWRTTTLRLPPAATAGARRLSIAWPLPDDAGPAPLDAVAERLEDGCEAAIHPLFGELASLRADTAAGDE